MRLTKGVVTSLKEHWSPGINPDELAEHSGCERWQAYCYYGRRLLGEQVKGWQRRGLSYRQIALKLHTTYSAVDRLIRGVA